MAWWNRELIKIIVFDIIAITCIYLTGFGLFLMSGREDETTMYVCATLGIVIGFVIAALIFSPLDKRWRTEYG